MPSDALPALTWFERTTGWSNSRRAWLGRLGLCGWLLAGVGGGLLSDRMVLEVQVALAGIWVIVLALLCRRSWRQLFGPVLFYELIRLARRPRYLIGRLIFVLLLAVMFGYTYFNWVERQKRPSNEPVPIHARAELAETFFTVYIVVQFLAVALLTPGFVAGSIAEEKERKTLEFMLATDLKNREIVFGKLAARVGNMSLLLLAGLPVLSFVQFFGGIDPDRLLAGFTATFLAMLGLSAASLLCSVTAKRGRDAVVLAYLLALTYFGTSLFALYVQSLVDAQEYVPRTGKSVTWADLAYAYGIGNPICGMTALGQSGADSLWRVVGQFALFQGIVVAGCVGWSVLRLRAVALRQSYEAGGKAAVKRTVGARPPVDDQPMIWKECYVDAGFKMGLLGRILLAFIALSSFALGIYIGCEAWTHDRSRDYFSEAMNVWARVAGTIVACLVLLGVAVHGAGSVRGERDRQTLDSLLTTPLSSRQIVWGKWWGCMYGMRLGWIWLGLIWVAGVVTGGINFLALPFLIGAMLLYASVFAWIGICCSIGPASALRSTMTAIIISVLAAGGYLVVLGFCCFFPLSLMSRGSGGDGMDTIFQFVAGFSPAVVLAWLPFHKYSDLTFVDDRMPFIPFVIFGSIAWLAASYFLSAKAVERFQKYTNRDGVRDNMEG